MAKNNFSDDPERAKEIAENNTWQNRRKENLKRHGLWDNENNDKEEKEE